MDNTFRREASIKIHGNHYFGTDYIFSNIYGSAVFTDEERSDSVSDIPDDELRADPQKGDYSPLTLEEFMGSDTDIFDLATMPDCSKEIEYSTIGTVESDGDGGAYIRYSGDFTPICMHICKSERVTLNGQEDDFSELVFETGKRNYVALPESLFNETGSEVSDDGQSPLQLCISTKSMNKNITEDSLSLQLAYSIEVNGITAEVTDFTLTAVPTPGMKEGL